MTAKRYTIQDIAKLAKVGVGTVSRVLNDDVNVKKETREQVLKLIEEVGYRPNHAARYIKNKKSNIIGLIADQVTTTPFANSIITGIQQTATDYGKVILVIDPIGDSELRLKAIRTMLDRDVEGIIYAAMFHQEVTLPKEFYQKPTVLVDCFTKNQNLPSVVPDEFQGGFDATELLIEEGHRKIAFLNNDSIDSGFPAPLLRLAGYKAALKKHKIRFSQKLVRDGPDAINGYKHANELLGSNKDITAFFCGTDRIAMGAYDAIKELGYSIPNDIAIVGFDNQEIISESLRPALTTMELPHAKMGAWAIEHLLDSNQNSTDQDGQRDKIELKSELKSSIKQDVQHKIKCDLIKRFSHKA